MTQASVTSHHVALALGQRRQAALAGRAQPPASSSLPDFPARTTSRSVTWRHRPLPWWPARLPIWSWCASPVGGRRWPPTCCAPPVTTGSASSTADWRPGSKPVARARAVVQPGRSKRQVRLVAGSLVASGVLASLRFPKAKFLSGRRRRRPGLRGAGPTTCLMGSLAGEAAPQPGAGCRGRGRGRGAHRLIRCTAPRSYASGPSEVPLLGETIGAILARDRRVCTPTSKRVVDVPAGRRWTYAQLQSAVRDLAAGLLAAGIRPG